MTDQPAQKSIGNILLLDDDKFLIDMYTMKFQQAGFSVHACLSTKDALQALRDGFAADAVLFDLIMPEGDGFSFLETLNNEKLATGAVKIALSNEMSDEEKTRVAGLGATRYIVKATMIPSEVVNSVREEMGKRAHA